MVDAMIPVLHPAGVQEFLDLGLHGIAASRHSGLWVGFKCVTAIVDSSATVSVAPDRVETALPEEPAAPADGLHIRWPDDRFEAEERLHEAKLEAVRAYARRNRLDRMVWSAPQARLGVVASGKSFLDVMQAFDDLGIDGDMAEALGLRLYKVALAWPLEPQGLRRFADGLEEIVVVEEKRGLIEDQIKTVLYGGARRAGGGRQSATETARACSRRRANCRRSASPRSSAAVSRRAAARVCRTASPVSPAPRRARRRRRTWCARPISAPAARTTVRPACPKAAAPSPASAATSSRNPWTATPRATATWAARESRGSARRRSPTRNTSSSISATAPISIPACWRSAPPLPPASTRPTRSSTTTQWR